MTSPRVWQSTQSNTYSHFASGLFDTRPAVYFLSVAAFVLFLTYQVVDYRRWKR